MQAQQYHKSNAEAMEVTDGHEVAHLLKTVDRQWIVSAGDLDYPQFLRHQLEFHWPDAIGSYLKALYRESLKQYPEALEAATIAVTALRRQWQEPSEVNHPRPNWSIPIMSTLISRYRILATLVDSLQPDGEPDKSTKACNLLRQFFADCQGDRNPNLDLSRKQGTLYVINNLFKIYFRLNNVRLSKALINSVEADGTNTFERYKMSQKVTYNYYIGRIDMFDGNYQKAEGHLQYAFENCHKKYVKNKVRVLIYLLTVQLVRGQFPKPHIISKYGLSQFSQLCRACRTGNVRLFDDTMAANQEWFIKRGIYVILQRAKIICYRNLVYNVYRSVNEFADINCRLKLEQVADAMRICGAEEDDADLEEVECIVANLIYHNYIKGYISHSMRMLVVAKANPFPRPG
jgi:tetratricopeptide (TPR) repeat protein